ncbi:MAG TPA: oligosaccharide flippase family protein [Candidatus Limnocylindria bacterium]|nr:oligosaccharide flippase family protein [Candidatus Limnocylindria bacterium]
MSDAEAAGLEAGLPEASYSRTKKTAALTAAALVVNLGKLALSVILARILTVTDLAAYNQTLLAYQTFIPVLGLGIPQAMIYLLSRNEGRVKALVNECFILLLGAGAVYALFIALGGRYFLAERVNNPLVADILPWMIPLALLTSADLIRTPVLVHQNRITFGVWYSAVSTVFRVACVIVAVLFARSAGPAITAYSLSFAFASAAGLAVVYRLLPAGLGRIRLRSLPGILKVALPLGVSGILAAFSRDLAKWVVSVMRTPEEFAVFSYGAMELPFVSTLTGVIGTVVIVDMVRFAKEGRMQDAVRLFRRTAEVTSYVIFPMMAFFLVAAEPFYRVLYTDRMLGAVPVFRIYLFLLPARTVQYNSLLIALGLSRGVMYRSMLGLAADAALSLLLVGAMGPVGASVASLLATYLVILPVNLYLISKSTGVHWKRVLPFDHFRRCLLAVLVPAALGAAIAFLPGIFSPLARLVLTAAVFAVSILVSYRVVFREDFAVWKRKALAMLKGRKA